MKLFKFIFHIDHIIVVIISLILTWLLSLCVYNISFLNPIDQALDDFSITDIFWEVGNTTTPDTCQLITLVDMTELHSRGDIAQLLNQIDAHKPLCAGVDLIFEGEKDDLLGNVMLESTILDLNSTFIFAKKLTEYNDTTHDFRSSVQSYFADFVPITEAYTNLTDNLQHATIRTYTTHQSNDGIDILSFPASIAYHMDTTFVSQNDNEILINYKNTIFPTIKYDEINQYPHLIEGRIVLIGTLKEEQDMHLTPLGKTPGMMIHAYSLLTILEHTKIHHFPWSISLIICFIMCWMLQIAITGVNKYFTHYNKHSIVYFMLSSNIISTIIFMTWLIIISYVLFILFIKYHILTESTILLASLVILMEGRGIYSAMINTLSLKHDWKIINNSLFLER